MRLKLQSCKLQYKHTELSTYVDMRLKLWSKFNLRRYAFKTVNPNVLHQHQSYSEVWHLLKQRKNYNHESRLLRIAIQAMYIVRNPAT
jgi:hypothetical protein